ncbi:MAG TPA: hypothetical protein VFJ05_06935 [Nitrososphaeraceae archaeon]|nr:hypothetical protein [Nitrososphaeraceae archaeon]
MSYEEPKPTDRLDLGGGKARKKAAESNFVDWRTSSRIADPDQIFKAVLQSRHVRDPKHVNVNVNESDGGSSQ